MLRCANCGHEDGEAVCKDCGVATSFSDPWAEPVVLDEQAIERAAQRFHAKVSQRVVAELHLAKGQLPEWDQMQDGGRQHYRDDVALVVAALHEQREDGHG